MGPFTGSRFGWCQRHLGPQEGDRCWWKETRTPSSQLKRASQTGSCTRPLARRSSDELHLELVEIGHDWRCRAFSLRIGTAIRSRDASSPRETCRNDRGGATLEASVRIGRTPFGSCVIIAGEYLAVVHQLIHNYVHIYKKSRRTCGKPSCCLSLIVEHARANLAVELIHFTNQMSVS
jgi:hypothetical protein